MMDTNSNYLYINETIQCLSKIQTAKNKTERQEYEAKLKELEQDMDIVPHIKNILEEISRISLDLKKSVIVYLKNAIKKRIEKKTLNKEQIVDIMNSLVEVIILGHVTDKISLANVNQSLSEIFASELISSNRQIVISLNEQLSNYIITMNENDNSLFIRCRPVASLFQLIISSQSIGYDACILEQQLWAIEYMVNKFKFNISSAHDVESLINYTILGRSISEYLFLSLLRAKQADRLDQILEIYSQKFSLFLLEALKMTCMDSNNENNLISFTGISNIDTAINTMKAKAFMVLIYMVQESGSTIRDTQLGNVCYQTLCNVLTSLDWITREKRTYISSMSKDSPDFPDYYYEILIYQMIIFLSRLLIREPFLTQFHTLAQNFCIDLLFPLLTATKQEYIDLQVNGDDYHRFITDILTNKKIPRLKTAAAMLLTKMTKKYIDLSNFVISFCLQIFDFCIQEAKAECLYEYPLIKTFSNLKFFQYPLEIQIDTCLLVICILSGDVNNTPHFKYKLRSLLHCHRQKLFQLSSVLIKDKLCAIYGTFLEDIYYYEELDTCFDQLSASFEFLFTQISFYKHFPGLAFQASNSLVHLISSQELRLISSIVVQKFLPNFISQIKDIEIDIFFDLLIDMMKHLSIDDYLITKLSQEAVWRIIKEVNSSSNNANGNGNYNVYINKCCNLLMTVAERNEKYIPITKLDDTGSNRKFVDMNKFEEAILPLVMYLANPADISFEDDIVCLLVTIMKSTKQVSPLVKKAFQFLYAYIEEEKGMTSELFELLNLVLIYDPELHFLLIEDNVKTFCKILKYGLQEDNEYQTSPMLSALLLQVFLAISKRTASADTANELISTVIDKLIDLDDIYTDKDNFDCLYDHVDMSLYISFVASLYAGMINNPSIVFQALNDKNTFYCLTTWTRIVTSFNHTPSCQSQIIVLGICSLLRYPVIKDDFSYLIPRFLSIAFELLVKEKTEDRQRLENKLKDQVKCNFVEDEKDFEDEDEDQEEDRLDNVIPKTKGKKIQIQDTDFNSSLISKGIYPTQNYDEYEIFSQTLADLEKNDTQTYLNWIDLLPDSHRIILEEMIHTRKVQLLLDNNVQIQIPRRIVKLKRTQPEDH